jgi:hypothetical protein
MEKDNSVEVLLYVLAGAFIAIAVLAFLSIWFELW